MPGERIDYSIERQRHEGFVGRAALLERLDRLLVEGDRWVVVTGGPGMGKSALLAAWLARREAAGAMVPHHFIRRGEYDWDDPAKLVSSLVAQLEERFPEAREPDADERKHPAARLTAMLSRVSKKLRGERLIILIDGLDEYDSPASVGDPLAAFLPHALPRGVSFLCATRPKHLYVELLEARDGELARIDLDDRELAADNEATVRTFWEAAAPALKLDIRFVDEAVTRAGGNLQHAATLRKHLVGLPPAQRRVEDIPRGLAALLTKSWRRIATDPVAVCGLGILCAAREALTLDELGAVAGWTDEATRQAFVRSARELLVETQRPDGQSEYRLHHDTIRAHIAKGLGAAALRGHHAALAQRLATWPAPTEAPARQYALRHALIHRMEAGGGPDAWRLAADMGFLETKCRELGAREVECDVVRAAARSHASGDKAFCQRFNDLARALVRESHWLRAAPEATAALVWNRLRQSQWEADEIDKQLGIPAETLFPRIKHMATRESPALVRNLVGHSDRVMACAVTVDGQRVVSASDDGTLKIWDLDSGHTLAALRGHRNRVMSCVVTPDGRRVVSASLDLTLKVWDLESGRVLTTLTGHASGVFACAVMTDGRRVVSASEDRTLKVWDLDGGPALATLEGHTGWVRACAVTADGQHVVSASEDRTLKVWDLESDQLLATLEGHTGGVLACAVMADGRRVVSASADRTLKIWDLERRCVLGTLRGHTDWVRACAVTGDDRRVVSASDDGTLRIWNVNNTQLLATLTGHADPVRACVVTSDGRRAISASADRTLKIWDLDGEALSRCPGGHDSQVRACVMTPNGRRVVSASDDGTLKIWDPENGHALATLTGHTRGVRACAVTADGRRVISASDDQTLKIWDLESGRALDTSTVERAQGDLLLRSGHAVGSGACAVTADGQHVISASNDLTLKLRDLESGHVLVTLAGHTGRVCMCALTPDGRRLVSAASDKTLRVWDLESARSIATLQGHTGWVSTCAVTADGRRVISGSWDETLKIWDLESGLQLATLKGHSDAVRACAVTPDGRRLVSASEDRTLKIWDLDTYTCLFTHRGDASFTAVAVTATAIVAGDIIGAVWFLDWPLPRRRPGDERGLHQDNDPPKKHTILFLAANPSGTDRLELDREVRAIQVELERSGYRDCFELVTWWAAEPLDLLRELQRLKPTVVHFSGYGAKCMVEHRPGELRRDVVLDPGSQGGLFFQGPDGNPRLVSTAALEQTFGAAGASVKLVILNACYSEQQANALLAHVDCVVGISGSIGDAAARTFAIGFYGGLGERESVNTAYKQGLAAMGLEGLHDSDRLQLKVRPGVDATQLVLAADSR